MPIRILAPEVANQIAAGEVVERPASAVKELIENSLDAGATDIRVEVREGGRRLLRVQDDGCGIPAAEASLAFQRHATSKIVSADDLDHIATLGFRGEALASIAAVAHATLLTRSAAEDAGTLIRMVEGREVERSAHGMPPGTVVTVEHLFANVPARLKFLKQPATEAAHIQQVITRYALAYPERRFSLVTDGKLLFQSTGSGKLYDVLVKVYGLEMAKQMIEVGAGERGGRAEERGSGGAEERGKEERGERGRGFGSPAQPFTHSPRHPITHSPVLSLAHSCHRLHRRAGHASQPSRLYHALRQPPLVPGYVDRLCRDPGVPYAAAHRALSGRSGLHRARPRRCRCQRASHQGRGALPRGQCALRGGATRGATGAGRSGAGARR